MKFVLILFTILSTLVFNIDVPAAEAPRSFAGIAIGQPYSGSIPNCKGGKLSIIKKWVSVIRRETPTSTIILGSPGANQNQLVSSFIIPSDDNSNIVYDVNCNLDGSIRLSKIGYYNDKVYYLDFQVPCDILPAIRNKLLEYSGVRHQEVKSNGVYEYSYNTYFTVYGIDDTVWMIEQEYYPWTRLLIYDENIMNEVAKSVNYQEKLKSEAASKERARKEERMKEKINELIK
jgi:hypothetical protein